MKPTEQDKGLEAELDKIFPCDCSFMKGFAFRPGDPCDGSCVNAPYRKAVLELITAYTNKQIEAVLDRLEAMAAYDPSGSSPVINPRQIEAERKKLNMIDKLNK